MHVQLSNAAVVLLYDVGPTKSMQHSSNINIRPLPDIFIKKITGMPLEKESLTLYDRNKLKKRQNKMKVTWKFNVVIDYCIYAFFTPNAISFCLLSGDIYIYIDMYMYMDYK